MIALVDGVGSRNRTSRRRVTSARHAACAHYELRASEAAILSPSERPVQVTNTPAAAQNLPATRPVSHALKRALDVTLAGAALLVLTPFLLVMALIVCLDSPGSPVFRQRRVGQDGRHFTMYKFRSMRRDADQLLQELAEQNEGAGPLFKLSRDPRITRVGRWMRVNSVDELPQLVNVFRGEMSLVGPRPALPSEVEQYSPRAQVRLSVKPGLTGLWQVSGRSDLDWEQSLALDLRYVESWSVAGDVVLLFRTVGAVATHRGAY